MLHGTTARLLRPAAALLFFLLTEVLLADGVSLSAAVAAAATAAAGSVFTVSAFFAARTVPAVACVCVRTAIRDCEQRTAFLPQRDPDASGRPRPRAPGRALLTAA
ncbi:hypothetical protein GCM10020367_24400 [Streptomyces sannanensis]|uniref:Secreted protein n=1 Tax=Streptomyces sannanensis TaxID=285536 RepID=A0ABP6SAK6_9ACTN